MQETIALSIKGISKSYPGVKALDNVSIDFIKGEVHALIGENGAGKSTLIKCVSGAISPDCGTMKIGDKVYNAMEPLLAKHNGIEVIYQEFNLVPSLSVAENVFLCKKTSNLIVNIKEREALAAKIFKQLKVDIDPSKRVRELSPAYQQIVEIAKAVSRDVKIMIMDEPTAPLTVAEVGMLFGVIRDLKAKGVTIIYISHRLEELFEIADRVSVLRDGVYIDTKNIADTSRKELISLMAGRTLNEIFPHRNHAIGEEILRVEDLSGNGVEHISFNLHRGEVLGFAGLIGAGRTELMRVIVGAAPIAGGKIYIDGKHVHIKNTGVAIKNSIGLIPEDRKNQGVFLINSIKWNIVINAIKSICKRGIVDEKKEKAIAIEYQRKFKIKAPSINQKVLHLSGGNQQKVAIAKTLATNSQILIFDEPTRGVDVGAKQEIYKLMNELAESGHAIIIVSSEMPELLGMSDRIVVISEGRQTGMLAKDEFDQNYILELASDGQ